LPETREAAETFIASKGLTDRVEFEAQDFFKPQQRKGKYLFVMQRGKSGLVSENLPRHQCLQFFMTGAQRMVQR